MTTCQLDKSSRDFLEDPTYESIALFGDREASGIVLLKIFEEYYSGYQDGEKEIKGYTELVNGLLESFPVGQMIAGENNQKEFIRLYSSILKFRKTFRYIDNACRDGNFQETGTAITRVLPPVSRFTPSGERTQKRETVLSKIKDFFQRFFDISG